MYDPISVDTALVSANGDLLISLTDGNIVNAGKVRGAQGTQGERGFIGERGEPGRDGINGAQWHTGVGMPEVSLGTSGDLYMDVANSLLPIYQKVGNDWLLLCNLKVPPSGGGGGSGGAAGGGGSVILFPSPLPGVPGPDQPTLDNDGNRLDKGDVWFDTTTGWLYVWNGSQWLAVSDRPPVIISSTPPSNNNASGEGNNPPKYNVKDGDLWLDPSSNQLYIYRDDAWSEITACTTSGSDSGPIDFPVGTDFPADGNQIPDGHTHEGFYWDATLGAWKRVCEGSQEHCVRHYRSICNGGTGTWTGTASYSSVYDIETEADEQDLNIKDVFEVQYAGQTDWIDVLDLDVTEQTRIGFDRVEDGSYHFTDAAEAAIKASIAVRHVVTMEDEDGNVYECPTTIIRYIYTSGPPPNNGNGLFGHADVRCCFTFGPEQKRYLLAHGDSVDDADTLASYHWTQGVYLSGVNQAAGGPYMVIGPNSAVLDSTNGLLSLRAYDGATMKSLEKDVQLVSEKGNISFDADEEIVTSADQIFVTADRKIELRSKFYNVELDAATHVKIKAKSGDVSIDSTAVGGKETVQRIIDDTDDLKQITNKEYVDEKDEELRQGIIELEEEIDAIAPSVEYGTWEWANPANNPRPPAAGTFHLLDATGALTDEYKDTKFIKIHNDEYLPPGSTDPVDTHTWADADPGKLIQLFDRADPDFLLGEIVTTTPDTDSVLIEVQLIQTSGVPNDNASGGVYLSRVNIFSAPTGGAAGDFVKIIGDTMLGNLKITTDANTNKAAILLLEGQRSSSINSCATVKFANDTSGTPAYLEYHAFGTDAPWFNFTQDVQFGNKTLSKITDVKLNGPGTISCLDHIAIKFKESPGSAAGDAQVRIEVPRELQRKGFLIRGRKSNGNDGDLFYNYRNSGTNGDSVDYEGICTTGTHIMNRDQGDSRFVQTGTKGIKITKSGSTYYIQGG